jgi:hypothetical protein
VKIIAVAAIAPLLVASSAIAAVPTSQTTVESAETSVLLGPSAMAARDTLRGSVGPGFTITLRQGGRRVARLSPGRYVVRISDRSDEHNFHLMGRGVNRSTSVPGQGTVTWRSTFSGGTYRYVCGSHAANMHGRFRVR